MAIAAICFGLFILCGVAFAGGLGQALYTYAACASAVATIFIGLASFKAGSRLPSPLLAALAALIYTPVTYRRLTFGSGPDWGGIVFDSIYIVFLVAFALLHRERPRVEPDATSRNP